MRHFASLWRLLPNSHKSLAHLYIQEIHLTFSVHETGKTIKHFLCCVTYLKLDLFDKFSITVKIDKTLQNVSCMVPFLQAVFIIYVLLQDEEKNKYFSRRQMRFHVKVPLSFILFFTHTYKPPSRFFSG